MSAKAMGWVWDQDLPQNEKFVLLAYADHAEHDGTNVYPAVGTVAKKTGYSRRSVQRITRQLEEGGYLIPDGDSEKGTNRWRIPVQYPYIGGDKMTPPNVTGGDKDDAPGGDTAMSGGSDKAMSPEPSFNRPLKPSLKESEVKGLFREWERSGGPITPATADDLKDLAQELEEHRLDLPEGVSGADVHGARWVAKAIVEARRSNSRGRINTKFVQAILDRWKVDGLEAPRDKKGDTREYDPIAATELVE